MDIKQTIEKILELIGLPHGEVTVDDEYRRISLVIGDPVIERNMPSVMLAFDHLINLIVKQKQDGKGYVVDVNFYRKERERLITELSRAAAKKAIMNNTEVELPPMNAYERRIVHLEIMDRPELTTESRGEGKERRVVIKKI